MRHYTKEEHEFMKDFVPGHSYKEIREAFLERFGGEVPKSFPKGFIKNNKLNTGRTGRFTKCRFLSHDDVGCLLNVTCARVYGNLDKKPRRLGGGSILIPSS